MESRIMRALESYFKYRASLSSDYVYRPAWFWERVGLSLRHVIFALVLQSNLSLPGDSHWLDHAP